MSIIRRATVALAMVGAAALLTACGSPTPAATETTTAAAPTTPEHSAAPAHHSAAPTHQAATTEGKCTLNEVKPSVGRTTGEAGTRHTVIVWTNHSNRACSMHGFGGVDLVGPNDPVFGPTYSLPRQSATPTTVHLPPGGVAHTVITWQPPQDGPGWTPTGMNVTPPDETHSAHLQWPGGAVLRQDAATHPGTFISPVQPGAG
ncbi:DUF4232 domain-containing protein [Pseudonocardia thermophila]|uniref:DUF4232 domain-containing protein n=2 Tax=Pseudonocardia thermophila TaxID=1848 RepID=UPI0031E93DEE